jgi:putative peptidoglycan lipid II flippase
LIMRAMFQRGAFTAADAAASGMTLRAYAIGLLAVVLIRSMTATFFARGDTKTPVKASLSAIAVNIALKVILVGALAQAGLALATSIGAWVNFILLVWLATRAGVFVIERGLMVTAAKLLLAGLILGAVLWFAQPQLARYFSDATRWHEELTLLALGLLGFVVYAAALVAFFGRSLRTLIRPKI